MRFALNPGQNLNDSPKLDILPLALSQLTFQFHIVMLQFIVRSPKLRTLGSQLNDTRRFGHGSRFTQTKHNNATLHAEQQRLELVSLSKSRISVYVCACMCAATFVTRRGDGSCAHACCTMHANSIMRVHKHVRPRAEARSATHRPFIDGYLASLAAPKRARSPARIVLASGS